MAVIDSIVKEKTVNGRMYKKKWYIIECDMCGITTEKKGSKSLLNKKWTFCSYECSNNSKKAGSKIEKERNKARISEKGHAYCMQDESIKQKRWNTIQERYGGHFQSTDEWKEKMKSGFLEKFGTEYIYQSDHFKQVSNSTKVERYGTVGIMSLEEFKEKSRITQEELYGGWYTGTAEHHARQKATNLEKYGLESFFQDPEVQKKAYIARNGCTREEYLSKLPAIEAYRNEVWKYTKQQDIKSLEHFEKRGRTGYHLDHKFSIIEGYNQGISPKIIGNICNLVFIPSKINQSKNNKCSITKQQLLEGYNGN